MIGAKVVVVGGGTGNYSVLSGLTHYPVDLTAVVAMSDSGGSSGRLRDELGQLPYGDVRQCLVALAGAEGRDSILKNLFAHRFTQNGDLHEHNMGNLMLAALTEIAGGPERAIEAAAELLKIKGRVLPVTLTRTHLYAVLTDGTTLEEESTIDTYGGMPGVGVDYVYLKPPAYSYAPVIQAILEADLIVFSPGDLYTSLVPNLLVEGVPEAILRSSAKTVLVCSLMTKPGETDGFHASTFVEEVNRYLGKPGRIDMLLANSGEMPKRMVQRYGRDGAHTVELDRERCVELVNEVVERPLIAEAPYIRHDSKKLAEALIDIVMSITSGSDLRHSATPAH